MEYPIMPQPHRIEPAPIVAPAPLVDICPSAPAPTYEDTVGGLLLAIPLGGVFDIAGRPKLQDPSARNRFIETAKSYIDRNMGHTEGWELEFETEYKSIKKIKRWN